MLKILHYILKQLAARVLKKYRPLVIGITGSVGKTSTKEAVFSVLRHNFKVSRNLKNYNNEIGVPLTILGCGSGGHSVFKWLNIIIKGLILIFKKSEYPEILILEMGADKMGDIEYLVKFAPCDIGVVTSVGEVHLEFFGSVENIIKEKRKIIAHLKESHLAILNGDDQNVLTMKSATQAKVVTFGFNDNVDVRAADIKVSQKQGEIGTAFKLHSQGSVLPVFLPKALGKQQVRAALVAIAIAQNFKLNLLDIAENLRTYQAPPARTNLIKGIKNSLLIDDSYNASPISAKAALDLLAEIEVDGGAKKIAVLGAMLELGGYTEAGHQEVGQKAAAVKVDMLVTVGEKTRDIIRGAIAAGLLEEKTFYFDNNHAAGLFVQNKLKEGDLVLIKGSQGARMEQITKELMAEPLRASELLVRQTDEWLKK